MRTAIWRKRVLLLGVVLLLAVQPAALAYLHSSSGTLSNTLSRMGKPDVQINETLGSTKQVRITNSGERPVKVEVWIAVVYRGDANPNDVLPATGVAFTGSDSGWLWGPDPYYAYWDSNLHQHESTGWLFTDVTADPAPEGYHLEVKVIAHNTNI